MLLRFTSASRRAACKQGRCECSIESIRAKPNIYVNLLSAESIEKFESTINGIFNHSSKLLMLIMIRFEK